MLMAPGLQFQRRAAAYGVVGALIWPLQAGLVAWAIGQALADEAIVPMMVAGAFAGLGLCRAAFSFVAEKEAQRAADSVIGAARKAMIAMETRRLEESGFGGAGAVASLATEKLDLLSPYATRYLPAQARVAVLPLVLVTAAFWHSWVAACILLVSGPLIPLFMALVGYAAKETSSRQLKEVGSVNDMLVERLSALLDIRLLGARKIVHEAFRLRSDDLRRRTMAVLAVAFLSSTVLELFAAVGVAMMAVYVGFSLLGTITFGAWGAALSPQSGIFLLLLAPDFYQPLRDLAAAWHDRASASAVADEFAAWQAGKTAFMAGRGERVAPLPGPASLCIEGCYSPGGRALPTISVAAGESLALVGPSGAGKTSLLRLMAGLSVPSRGLVLVAGRVVLTDANCDAWRARLGWMPQAPHFLNSSIRDNIMLGRQGDLAEVLRRTGAEAFVQSLPGGTLARLGESGAGISGGEARRLMLARAIFGCPDVILADEPTADLDPQTADIVTQTLLSEVERGATLIVATHDMRLAQNMHRMIRLGAGS